MALVLRKYGVRFRHSYVDIRGKKERDSSRQQLQRLHKKMNIVRKGGEKMSRMNDGSKGEHDGNNGVIEHKTGDGIVCSRRVE